MFFVRAVPLDSRIPWILIPKDEVPRTINLNEPLIKGLLYVARIAKWPEHSNLPIGRIEGCCGQCGDPDSEIMVALQSFDLAAHIKPFVPQLEAEAQARVDEVHSDLEAEFKERMDFRSHCRTFTIDPSTARDLDDAIHIVDHGNVIEVGVHIADVSHYVLPDSLIDFEASSRCTTVYVPTRAYPMLPSVLSSNVCSLNPYEDKLCLSVILFFDYDGNLSVTDNPVIGKTVIRSSYRFTYDEVQDILDSKHVEPKSRDMDSWRGVCSDLLLLQKLSRRVRRRRFENGSLKLEKTKLIFDLSPDNFPIDFHYDLHTESHELVEEMMLMANTAVAERLASSGLNEIAVLRRHPPPDSRLLSDLQRYLSKLDIHLDISSSGSLHQSLQDIRNSFGENAFMGVQSLIKKPMNPAEYFVYGENQSLEHYALNFPLYTHFTSPIRRYADILVHRAISMIISTEKEEMDPAELSTRKTLLESACRRCNIKKRKAREAQEKCDVAFFCMNLLRHGEPLASLATVLVIQDRSIVIAPSKMTKESRLWLVSAVKESDTETDEAKSQQSQNKQAVDPYINVPDEFKRWIDLPATYTIKSKEEVEARWDVENVLSIKTFSQIPVWILPVSTVPLDYVSVLVPPYHAEFRDIMQKANSC